MATGGTSTISGAAGLARRFWRHADALLLLLLGLLVLLGSRSLAFGDLQNPGPGLFPICIAMILLMAAAVTVATPLHGTSAGAETGHRAKETLARFLPLVGITGASCLFALLAPRVGLLAASLACVLVATVVCGNRHPIRVLLFSVLLALATAGLFIEILRLPFPYF